MSVLKTNHILVIGSSQKSIELLEWGLESEGYFGDFTCDLKEAQKLLSQRPEDKSYKVVILNLSRSMEDRFKFYLKIKQRDIHLVLLLKESGLKKFEENGLEKIPYLLPPFSLSKIVNVLQEIL